jgi:hypothetical protein
MKAVENAAWEAFIAQLGDQQLLAQVLVRRQERGFELRHAADHSVAAETLRQVKLEDLRSLARFTDTGAFRPLKSAPNLSCGWRATAANHAELEAALNQLYPGAIADWFAARVEPPPVTGYREFTERQTGMYRITTLLNDEQAGQVARACCAARFCLKRRLWTVAGLEPDPAEAKSQIPCLEPCAVLLEFARKAVRLEQEKQEEINLSPAELKATRSTLEAALDQAGSPEKEADFNDPGNPRRLQLALEKLESNPSAAHAPKK